MPVSSGEAEPEKGDRREGVKTSGEDDSWRARLCMASLGINWSTVRRQMVWLCQIQQGLEDTQPTAMLIWAYLTTYQLTEEKKQNKMILGSCLNVVNGLFCLFFIK